MATKVTRGVAISIDSIERREFRRLFLASGLAHAALALFLVVSPNGEIVMPQGVISVELVSIPAPAAPAKSASAPKAAPRPPPAPKQIVLPKQTAAPAPAAKAVAKPKPAPAPAPTAEPTDEKDYADVLSDLRKETGDEAPAAAPAQAASIGSPTGRPVSPEFLAWERRARIHIRQNWVVPPSFRNQPLRTGIMVELDSSGVVLSEPRIVKRSGNPWYDDGVVRSLQKASPLPAPPEAGDWSFVFVADETY